jgi:hypothetical protein
MKLKNIIYSTTLAALMIAAVTGCSKKKFDINGNPNDVTDVSVSASVLLPGALQYTSSTIASEWWFIGWWMGHGARSTTYQSFNEEETYRFTNDFHAGIWNQLYYNATNYNLMINDAAKTGAGTYEAIGRIVSRYWWMYMVMFLTAKLLRVQRPLLPSMIKQLTYIMGFLPTSMRPSLY